jgi:hypothetical protein
MDIKIYDDDKEAEFPASAQSHDAVDDGEEIDGEITEEEDDEKEDDEEGDEEEAESTDREEESSVEASDEPSDADEILSDSAGIFTQFFLFFILFVLNAKL